jgi:hypothetical protein
MEEEITPEGTPIQEIKLRFILRNVGAIPAWARFETSELDIFDIKSPSGRTVTIKPNSNSTKSPLVMPGVPFEQDFNLTAERSVSILEIARVGIACWMQRGACC